MFTEFYISSVIINFGNKNLIINYETTERFQKYLQYRKTSFKIHCEKNIHLRPIITLRNNKRV